MSSSLQKCICRVKVEVTQELIFPWGVKMNAGTLASNNKAESIGSQLTVSRRTLEKPIFTFPEEKGAHMRELEGTEVTVRLLIT